MGDAAAPKVKALQCLLTEKGAYTGKIDGVYDGALLDAVRAWQRDRGMLVKDNWSRRNWMSLVAAGSRRLVKFGSAGAAVRRLQRALNASGYSRLNVRGVFNSKTDAATRTWQRKAGFKVSGVVTAAQWKALQAGKR